MTQCSRHMAYRATLPCLTALAWLLASTGRISATCMVLTCGALSLLWAAQTLRGIDALDGYDTRLRSQALVWAAIVGAWIVVAALPPLLSGDLYRYLFDGTLSNNGINPFAYAPASPKVADLRELIPGPINHPEMRTVYPPGAQALFALSTQLAGPSVVFWKLVCSAAAFGAAGLLGARFGSPVALAFVTSPLLLVAAAGGGHIDVVGAAVLTAAVLTLIPERHAASNARGQAWLSGVFFALAAGIKFLPLVLVPAAARRSTRARQPGYATTVLIVAVVVFGASYIPLSSIGPKALGNLWNYAQNWMFNGSVAPIATGALRATCEAFSGGAPGESYELGVLTAVNELLGIERIYGGVPTHGSWWTCGQFADQLYRWLATVALVLLAAGLILRRHIAPTPAKSVLVLLATWIVLSPVVHPWYCVWLLPVALMERSEAGIMLCGTMVFAWLPHAIEQDTGAWPTSLWLGLVVYAPPMACWAVVKAGRWRRRVDDDMAGQ